MELHICSIPQTMIKYILPWALILPCTKQCMIETCMLFLLGFMFIGYPIEVEIKNSTACRQSMHKFRNNFAKIKEFYFFSALPFAQTTSTNQMPQMYGTLVW